MNPEEASLRSDRRLEEMSQVIQEQGSFLLLSHVRPDGDALGSQLALGWALEAMGRKVTYWNEGPLPENLNFLPGIEKIACPTSDDEGLDVDVVIALDTANQERLGASVLSGIASFKHWLTIDHHISNEGYGDLVYIDGQAPATGQIIHRLLTRTDLPFPKESVENLYVGLSTDTGSFQYGATSAETHEVAADLLRRGLDVARVNQLTYMNHGLRRVKLLQTLLNHFQISDDGRVADVQLSMEDKKSIGYQAGDGEGLIDVIRGINTVLVAAWFEELPDGKIRVSTRSKDPAINVNEICNHFGGGGHAMAAGIRMGGSLKEAREKVLEKIQEAIEDLWPL